MRQKLLEHVAAAVFMQPSEPPGETTPPRSPIKGISPVRSETMKIKEETVVEEEKMSKRQAVESIKIYADSDVFALLADVEEEINRMSEHPATSETQPQEKKRYRENPELLRQTVSAPSSIPSKSEDAKPHIQTTPPKSPGPTSPILLRAMVFTMPKRQGVKV